MRTGIGVPLSFAGYYFATSLLRKKIKTRFIFNNLQNFITYNIREIGNLKNIFKPKYTVCFIGVDGAGKNTTIDSLVKIFQPLFRVSVVYMGRKNFSLPIIRLYKYLKYDLKKQNNKKRNISKPTYVGVVELIASLFELYFRYIKSQLNPRTDIILFDRYFFDNIILSKNKISKAIMYAIIPRPNITFFLNAPVDVLYERKHESDMKVLLAIQRMFKIEQNNIGFIEINTADNNVQEVLFSILEQVGEDACKAKREL